MIDRIESWIERFDPVAALRVGLTLAALGGALTLASTCAGCGASPAQHHARLNAMTDVADPTYAIAVELCDTMRDAVVARPGTTYAQDRAAFDRIHGACDPMIEGFEALRGSQLTARAAVEDDPDGAVAQAILTALAAWPQVQRTARAIDTLGMEAP